LHVCDRARNYYQVVGEQFAVAGGGCYYLVAALDNDYVDVLGVAQVKLDKRFVLPAFGRADLYHAKTLGERHDLDDVGLCEHGRESFAHIFFGDYDGVRADLFENELVPLVARFCDDFGDIHLLAHKADEYARFYVGCDTYYCNVHVVYAQTFEVAFVGCVHAHGVRAVRRYFVYQFFVLIDDENFRAVFV